MTHNFIPNVGNSPLEIHFPKQGLGSTKSSLNKRWALPLNYVQVGLDFNNDMQMWHRGSTGRPYNFQLVPLLSIPWNGWSNQFGQNNNCLATKDQPKSENDSNDQQTDLHYNITFNHVKFNSNSSKVKLYIKQCFISKKQVHKIVSIF